MITRLMSCGFHLHPYNYWLVDFYSHRKLNSIIIKNLNDHLKKKKDDYRSKSNQMGRSTTVLGLEFLISFIMGYPQESQFYGHDIYRAKMLINRY